MCELQLIVQKRYTQKPLYCNQMELSMYQIDIGVHKKVRQYDFLIVWLCTAYKLVKKFVVLLQWTIIFSSYRGQLWKFSDWKSASNCHLARFDIHCTALSVFQPFLAFSHIALCRSTEVRRKYLFWSNSMFCIGILCKGAKYSLF